jgi:hypothetical protein
MRQLRSHGISQLLAYCGSITCNHQVVMDADHLSDDTLIRPLGNRMVCSRCGHVGADVRPNWAQKSEGAHGAGSAHRR